ncbi:hypothetical protein D3C72_1677560 [compost metagenome]
MQPRHALRDRNAEAVALLALPRSATEEAIAQPRQHVRRDARALVEHRDAVGPEIDGHQRARRAVADGVVEQVAQQQRQQVGVTRHRQWRLPFRGPLQLDVDLLPLRQSQAVRQRLLRHRDPVDRLA